MFENLNRYHFNSTTGPVWCARLVQDKEYNPMCPAQKMLNADFPYKSHLFFGFHHGITDGFSNMHTFNFFLTILNQVLEKQQINDEIQLAEYSPGKIYDHILSEIKNYWETNPLDKLEANSVFIKRRAHEANLPKVDQDIKETISRTRNIQRVLDKNRTEKFMDSCKEASVTVNSAFTAIASIALFELMRELGSKEDFMEVLIGHMINRRRYWGCDSSRLFGPHIGQLPQTIQVSSKSKESFWDFAKEVHKNFYEMLKNKTSFKQDLIKFENINNMTPIQKSSEFDFGVTNMGNLNKIISDDGKHVQISSLISTTSSDVFRSIGAHVLQTFRGYLYCGLDYGSLFMTSETANRFADIISKHLHDLVDH